MIIDLSVPISELTPVYPGDPLVQITPAGDLAHDGYCDHLLSIGTHAGTHIDAPAHMIAGGKTLNQIHLDQFVGNGKYIKLADGSVMDVIKRAGIQAGDIVLFDTGMAAKYYDKVYFEDYPVITEEIAHYLVEHKVKMVGLDTGSADNQDGFPIHKILLGGDVLIIENLTNLQQLAEKDFMVYALPLNLDLDGSPARVIAVVNI